VDVNSIPPAETSIKPAAEPLSMKNIEDLIDDAAELAEQGHTKGEIADELNISRETASWLVNRSGVAPRPKRLSNQKYRGVHVLSPDMVNADFSVNDGIARIELRRPDALNAVDMPTKLEMIDRLQEYRDDDDVRSVGQRLPERLSLHRCRDDPVDAVDPPVLGFVSDSRDDHLGVEPLGPDRPDQAVGRFVGQVGTDDDDDGVAVDGLERRLGARHDRHRPPVRGPVGVLAGSSGVVLDQHRPDPVVRHTYTHEAPPDINPVEIDNSRRGIVVRLLINW